MKRYVSATSTSKKYDIYTDVDTIRAIAQDYGDDGDEWIDESRELLADNGLEFYGIGVAKDKYYEKLSFDGEELITVGINPDGSLVYGIFVGDRFCPVNATSKVTAGSDATYQNRRNPNKFIETRKYSDGHTVARQYMKWDTPNGEVKNYTGAKDAKRGRFARVNKDTLQSMLDDYDQIYEGWSDWERIPGSTAFRLNYTIDGELIGYVDEGRECYIAYDAQDRQLGAFEDISEAQIAVEDLV